ncbi:hypothetical protein Ahy_B06g080798 isoform C [Arachis hypogaea]|uniref:Proline-tRNA ligase class II C-terminal domain-containing protein n=1 Tax=Arachis hypogaea TaxID=3818 RepID=A0A444YJ59_ARAHY|nr:hypothetical protein Ahy_B06g080798 isoform C [Arachis hypogaea]
MVWCFSGINYQFILLQAVEADVKARTKGEMGAAKTLCSPFDQPELPEGTKCFASEKPAKKWSYWGRSY